MHASYFRSRSCHRMWLTLPRCPLCALCMGIFCVSMRSLFKKPISTPSRVRPPNPIFSSQTRRGGEGVPTYPGPPPLPTYPKCGTPTLPYPPKILPLMLIFPTPVGTPGGKPLRLTARVKIARARDPIGFGRRSLFFRDTLVITTT